jgi:tetratricopeptide (TPR) repeat protein
MICPNCHLEASEGKRFCGRCGSALAPVAPRQSKKTLLAACSILAILAGSVGWYFWGHSGAVATGPALEQKRGELKLNPSPIPGPSTSVRAARRQAQAYNDFNSRGNVAAQNGDFEKAIALWQKAIPLDPGPVVGCRGEFQRNDIKAANDTISMLRQRKLHPAEAPKWFTNHSIELWIPNACNSN